MCLFEFLRVMLPVGTTLFWKFDVLAQMSSTNVTLVRIIPGLCQNCPTLPHASEHMCKCASFGEDGPEYFSPTITSSKSIITVTTSICLASQWEHDYLTQGYA